MVARSVLLLAPVLAFVLTACAGAPTFPAQVVSSVTPNAVPTAAVSRSPGTRQPTVAVSTFAKNPDGYADVGVDQLAGMLANKDFTLVNVHVPYEGELPQTDLFIPYNTIGTHLDQLPANKDAAIVLYCRSGSMSTQAARTLAQLGYTNVMEMDGGFNAWKAAGYTLLSK